MTNTLFVLSGLIGFLFTLDIVGIVPSLTIYDTEELVAVFKEVSVAFTRYMTFVLYALAGITPVRCRPPVIVTYDHVDPPLIENSRITLRINESASDTSAVIVTVSVLSGEIGFLTILEIIGGIPSVTEKSRYPDIGYFGVETPAASGVK